MDKNDKVKVRYSFHCSDIFTGEMEMTRDEYEKFCVLGSDDLATKLSDMVDISDPTDFEYSDCDTFHIID